MLWFFSVLTYIWQVYLYKGEYSSCQTLRTVKRIINTLMSTCYGSYLSDLATCSIKALPALLVQFFRWEACGDVFSDLFKLHFANSGSTAAAQQRNMTMQTTVHTYKALIQWLSGEVLCIMFSSGSKQVPRDSLEHSLTASIIKNHTLRLDGMPIIRAWVFVCKIAKRVAIAPQTKCPEYNNCSLEELSNVLF